MLNEIQKSQLLEGYMMPKFRDLSIVNLEIKHFSKVTRLYESYNICTNHNGYNQINVSRSSCCPSLVTIGGDKLHFYYLFKIAWFNKNGSIKSYQVTQNGWIQVTCWHGVIPFFKSHMILKNKNLFSACQISLKQVSH